MPPTTPRALRFASLNEAFAAAESLASVRCETVGRFSTGQIFDHLARTIEMAIGERAAPKMPLIAKWYVRLFRKKLLNSPFKPGMQLPSEAQDLFWSAADIAVPEAMRTLRRAVARFQETERFPSHALFGKLSKADQEKMQCRHMELHLGFIYPLNDACDKVDN